MVKDLRAERAAEVPYPPGETNLSIARSRRFVNDPLSLLLDSYERFGPVFTLRLFYIKIVFMIGPQANHYVTVSHASNFTLRDSLYRDFIDFVGDGMLTTDGAYHRRARSLALPAFHRERIAASAAVIAQEAERALEQLQPGARVELHAWTHELVQRIATRAVVGLDGDAGVRTRALLDRGLAYYSSAYALRGLRGPGTPRTRRAQSARKLDRLIYAEIARRRASGERGADVVSALIDARDKDGEPLTDRQIRDEAVGMLVAARDTTTAAITFMLYELSRHPQIAVRLLAEQRAQLAAGAPSAAALLNGELAELDMALAETLRKYPPSWIGPRRARASFEFDGHSVPGGAFVTYSAWASHHLPDVFAEPDAFRPERFAADAAAALPKGAYLPFGGGSRSCIGMRFAQLTIRMVVTLLLQRCALELPEDFQLTIAQTPSLSPKHGLHVTVREPHAASA